MGKAYVNYLTQFIPRKISEPAGQVLSAVTNSCPTVRGQVTVHIVAVMFIIFFKIFGLRYVAGPALLLVF